jgi:hypothetical protein
MCQNRLMSGTSKMCGSGISHVLQLDFGRVVTTLPRRLIGRCRNVDFAWDGQCPVFYSCLKSCALHRDPEIVTLSNASAANV